MKEQDYQYLIGMTHQQVFEVMGIYYCKFGYPDQWIYKVSTNWFGRTILLVYFNEDVVCRVRIIKKIGNTPW